MSFGSLNKGGGGCQCNCSYNYNIDCVRLCPIMIVTWWLMRAEKRSCVLYGFAWHMQSVLELVDIQDVDIGKSVMVLG